MIAIGNSPARFLVNHRSRFGRQLGDRHLQRAALEQRMHLVGVLDHLAAGEQQRAVGIAHIERQRLADAAAR